MSQHRWMTRDNYEVLTGYDRPMACFFLDISRTCEACHGTGATEPAEGNKSVPCSVCRGAGVETLYCNLDHGDGRMTLVEVEQALNKYLTAFPREVILRLASDRQKDTGNEITAYPRAGQARHDENTHP